MWKMIYFFQTRSWLVRPAGIACSVINDYHFFFFFFAWSVAWSGRWYCASGRWALCNFQDAYAFVSFVCNYSFPKFVHPLLVVIPRINEYNFETIFYMIICLYIMVMYHKLLIRCSNRKIKLSTLLNVARQNLEKMLAFFLFF